MANICIKCGGKTTVADSRPKDNLIWRRRECMKCGNKYTTYEITKDEYDKLFRKINVINSITKLTNQLLKGDV